MVRGQHEVSLRIKKNFEGWAQSLWSSTMYLLKKSYAIEFSWELMSSGNGFDWILVLSIKSSKTVLNGIWYTFSQWFREEFRQWKHISLCSIYHEDGDRIWLKFRCVLLSVHQVVAVLLEGVYGVVLHIFVSVLWPGFSLSVPASLFSCIKLACFLEPGKYI